MLLPWNQDESIHFNQFTIAFLIQTSVVLLLLYIIIIYPNKTTKKAFYNVS